MTGFGYLLPTFEDGAGHAATDLARRVRCGGRPADGWLPYPPTPELYAAGWRRVRDEGRDVTPGLYVTVALDPSTEMAQRRPRTTVQRWYGRPFEAGVRYVVLRAADDDPRRGLDSLSRAIG